MAPDEEITYARCGISGGGAPDGASQSVTATRPANDCCGAICTEILPGSVAGAGALIAEANSYGPTLRTTVTAADWTLWAEAVAGAMSANPTHPSRRTYLITRNQTNCDLTWWNPPSDGLYGGFRQPPLPIRSKPDGGVGYSDYAI